MTLSSDGFWTGKCLVLSHLAGKYFKVTLMLLLSAVSGSSLWWPAAASDHWEIDCFIEEERTQGKTPVPR